MNKFKFLIFIFVLFTQSKMLSTDFTFISVCPKETVNFNVLEDKHTQWIPICNYSTPEKGLIEYIPSSQSIENWSELISIQYFDRCWDRNVVDSIDVIIEQIKKEAFSRYPNAKISWKIVDGGNNVVIYEWSLNETYKNIPKQHEISKAILTDNGFYRVAFTRKYSQMNTQERNRWIDLLKKNITVNLGILCENHGKSP